MNTISPGEITKGMFIMGYEQLEPKPRMSYFGVPIEQWDDEDKNQLNLNPWFKGMSFEVAETCGPIIVLKTPIEKINVAGLLVGPVVIMDTRITHFMEVDEDYHINSWKAYGITINRKQPIKPEIIEEKEIPFHNLDEELPPKPSDYNFKKFGHFEF